MTLKELKEQLENFDWWFHMGDLDAFLKGTAQVEKWQRETKDPEQREFLDRYLRERYLKLY